MPLIPRFSVYRPASRKWDAGPVSLFSLMTCLTDWDHDIRDTAIFRSTHQPVGEWLVEFPQDAKGLAERLVRQGNGIVQSGLCHSRSQCEWNQCEWNQRETSRDC